jgi:glycine cleavage system H protein
VSDNGAVSLRSALQLPAVRVKFKVLGHMRPSTQQETLSMSQIPTELRFSRSHEWARVEEDGSVTVGISDHAQDALGDVVFVELPEIGAQLGAGDEAGVVESVKAASDIYAPVGGEVVAINSALEDAPETINGDPYGEGWLFRLRVDDEAELGQLLDATAYAEHLEAEG